MEFTVGFLNNGAPDDTLSPVVNIWEAVAGGTKVVTNGAMDLINTGSGGYTYDYAGADPTKNYYGLAYASTLPTGQQYAICISTVQGEVSDTLADTTAILVDTGDTLPTQIGTVKTDTEAIIVDVADVQTDTTQIIADVADVKTDTETIITNLALAQVDIDFLRGIAGGGWHVINNQMIFYNEAGAEIKRHNLTADGVPAIEDVDRRVPV